MEFWNLLRGIWRKLDRVDRYVLMVVGGLFLFLAILGFLTAAFAGSPQDDPELCVIALEGCELEHQTDAAFAKQYKAELDQLRKDHAAKLKERERTWESIYENVRQAQAGVECWARVEELEKRLEDEVKFYHWRLKSCGAIREKTKGAVRRYEKQVDALLSEREEGVLDD